MEQRRLGRTGLDVGAIGLGTEYLLHSAPETIARVIATAAEQGVSYIDLLYSHRSFLDKFAPALQPVRERVTLAVHLGNADEGQPPAWFLGREAVERLYAGALAQLGTEYADVVLIQILDFDDGWRRCFEQGLEIAQRLQREGRARYVGASLHHASYALEAVKTGAVDVLMYPVNMAGHAIPGNAELFAACARERVGLVAMKPYGGGKLLPGHGSNYMHWFQAGGAYVETSGIAGLTPVQCLSYVLAQPGVCATVPGVKDERELAAALHYLEATAEERDLTAVTARFRTYEPGECTYCNHCLPCPAGIDVGELIRLTDQARAGLSDALRAAYAALPAHATDCTFCETCMERCPFKVHVVDRMNEAMDRFGRG
ncbi:MAG TPA: aldo/keto reductase [Anaerolineae bacterium]|nr:aldo/keto reductase [Anaerolineae bacterium]HOG46034.1 aldo/keto reductase [Anaerolineae bacterium]HOR00121.1 aldo/keto reductase [Anaerolineae bacterium]HPL28184.1 aldo/keto reductase [Anaerolineae bacterium]